MGPKDIYKVMKCNILTTEIVSVVFFPPQPFFQLFHTHTFHDVIIQMVYITTQVRLNKVRGQGCNTE